MAMFLRYTVALYEDKNILVDAWRDEVEVTYRNNAVSFCFWMVP
jgi:hypothetical protein